jgi:pimeloyl-ACP methyl ester carboxylesterase
MKSPLRVIAKLVFLAVVVALFAGGVLLAWSTSWRSDKIASLDGASEVVKTKAGPVEFLVGGEGPVVLVFHGAPGGYDQAMLLASGLRDDGFQVIAPSRPGYLRTPLETGLLPTQQADAMAALLDDLGIQSVAVLGFSEGAPAALYFTLRHPERVAAMALLSPVTRRCEPPAAGEEAGGEFGRAILRGLTGDVGAWAAFEVAERDPRRGVEWLLELTSLQDRMQRSTTAHLVAANLEQRDWFEGLIGTFNPLSLRESGARNDLIQNRALDVIPFAKVAAPTLFLHGELDRCIPLADSRAAAAAIPGATLAVIPGAGHIVQLGEQSAEVRKTLTEFFRRYTGGQGSP